VLELLESVDVEGPKPAGAVIPDQKVDEEVQWPAEKEDVEVPKMAEAVEDVAEPSSPSGSSSSSCSSGSVDDLLDALGI